MNSDVYKSRKTQNGGTMWRQTCSLSLSLSHTHTHTHTQASPSHMRLSDSFAQTRMDKENQKTGEENKKQV